ncbi:MAG TPA: AbrB/MazE/SpoVT family DNA-binding domain-containing protein [Stellaceae bacterium]|jgi:antitoxin MazE|nr:AbrB/MazE/SpoVT family DNA-binding domain-containing protein [Stellaceae bacterium]
MRAAVRKLGNSSGVIIPKSLLRELGVGEGDPVEMTLEAGRIVLVPIKRRARAGWSEASHAIAEEREDSLVWPEFANAEDDTLIW